MMITAYKMLRSVAVKFSQNQDSLPCDPEWPAWVWPEQPIRAKSPSRRILWGLRTLILLGFLSLVVTFIWLFGAERRGDAILFWPLAITFIYYGLCWIYEWMNYARPKIEPFRAPQRQWTVDVLTTACPGEPHGMILRTLQAMKAIRYPHTNYLCDEGDDPVLREACRKLGIIHVTRKEKHNAKAGNINNALAQSRGEIAVVLDPDHEPSPYMLDRVLGYFEDPKVGFVQSVQAYRNQSESLVADGAAKQTYLFYGPMMMGMNSYGTTQAIGANCVFRREALTSIGGHAPGLAEDMHTAMRLYSKGWRSVYVPEILTRGLVPSTLSAYYKQQVKWSCGTTELLLHEYPKLFRGFNIWQRLHYFFTPFMYLSGFFKLVEIIVPIGALLFGGVTLRASGMEFLAWCGLPVIIMFLVRQRTQVWVIEKRDRGFHMVGGVLSAGTWWVYLMGTLCALFGRKIPYMPTPKEKTLEDSWKIAAPNFIAAGLSLAAVIYGLSEDFTPHSMVMAVFALANAATLVAVGMLAQPRTLWKIRQQFARLRRFCYSLKYCARRVSRVHQGVLTGFREHPAVFLMIGVVLASGCYFVASDSKYMGEAKRVGPKETGGFYLGINLQEKSNRAFPSEFSEMQKKLNTKFRIFPLNQTWGPATLTNFPHALMREARLHGATPMVTWEPLTSTFPEFKDHPELSADKRVFAAILRGELDNYLKAYAKLIREFGEPVFIRFAPEPDNPAHPWSASGGNTSEQFIGAWIYVYNIFNEAGANNVAWVWNPSSPAGVQNYFPGADFVDWAALTSFNRDSENAQGQSQDFVTIYEPFRSKLLKFKLPVMLADLDIVGPEGRDSSKIANTLASVAKHYPEIRGIVFSGSGSDLRSKKQLKSDLQTQSVTLSDNSPAIFAAIKNGLAHSKFRSRPAADRDAGETLWTERKRNDYRSPFISGTPGNFELKVDGAPFYVRGIAYNTGHDWRDGNIPPTRREVRVDMALMRAMGANTIRRYGSSIYDRNILNEARAQNLKVLYGFWLDQDIDYFAGDPKLRKYEDGIQNTVRNNRDNSAVLAWTLGNEVWGLLKHKFAQPYLTEVRHAHINFVEGLAQKIHEIDPRRAVFVAHEHSDQLAGTLSDFRRGAPSLDFIGVNSYYESRISRLDGVVCEFDSARPYLITEFGPEGYWDSRLTKRYSNGATIEPSSKDKTQSYARGWSIHTESHRGHNIGGVAYSWRDRYEETATWFGITDFQRRPKPAFATLKQQWTGRAASPGPRVVQISAAKQTLAPGSTIELQGILENPPTDPSQYRWWIASENFEMNVGQVRKLGNGSRAQITLPKEPGNYRVYLSVGSESATDTGNIALQVDGKSGIPPALNKTTRTISLHESSTNYSFDRIRLGLVDRSR